MNMNDLDQGGYVEITEKKAYRGLRFSSGLAYGAILGTAFVWYAASLMNKAAASREVGEVEVTLKRTGEHARRIGDTARYTIRTLRGKLFRGKTKQS